MNRGNAHRIIFVSMVLTVFVGSGAKVVTKGQWPSMKYLVGIAISYLGISALAEWEPNVATPLAGAILATTVFGNNDGIIAWFDTGETKATGKPTTKQQQQQQQQIPPVTVAGRTVTPFAPGTPPLVPLSQAPANAQR